MNARPWILALVLVAAFTAHAEADVEAQVDAYLGSIDTPIRMEQWRALGPQAVAILERRLRSIDGLPTARARAAEALGLVGSEQHASTLLALAGEAESPLVVRLAALRAAGRLLPPEKLAVSITPLLEHDPVARIRATAADILTDRLGASGCERVQRQLKIEEADTHGMFTPALKRCGGARRP